MQPGATKFIYYFVGQNVIGTPLAERVRITKHLMELSERELLELVETLNCK